MSTNAQGVFFCCNILIIILFYFDLDVDEEWLTSFHEK